MKGLLRVPWQRNAVFIGGMAVYRIAVYFGATVLARVSVRGQSTGEAWADAVRYDRPRQSTEAPQ